MMLVTFSEPMVPYGVGDTRLVPDDVAENLKRDGVISSAEPWPPSGEAPPAPVVGAPQKPARPVLRPTRPAGRPADQRIAR